MDYTIWGIGTAIIGALCYLAGRLHSATQPKPQEPVTRPMQAVERPVEEQPTQVVPALEATASWEREFDKIMDDAWKKGW